MDLVFMKFSRNVSSITTAVIIQRENDVVVAAATAVTKAIIFILVDAAFPITASVQ